MGEFCCKLIMWVSAFLICFISLPNTIIALEKAVHELEEIVVTSTRTKHSVLETPSNIAVVTAKDIEGTDAKTILDVLKKIPGTYYTNSSGLEPKISLRGTRVGMGGGALVLLNGIPMGMGKFAYTDWEGIPVENIERVEVVKGPMSSLYGGDSSRGVINIITKRAKDLSGKVGFIAGDFHDKRYNGLVFGSRERFDYNLNIKTRKSDGYRDKSKIDSNYLTGEIGYCLSNATRLAFNVNVADKKRTLAKKMSKAQKDEDRNQPIDLSYTENTDFISGINLKTNQSSFDLSTTLYYKNRDKTVEQYYYAATRRPYKDYVNEDVYGIRSLFTLKKPVAGKTNLLSAGFDYDIDNTHTKRLRSESTEVGLPYVVRYEKTSGDFKREEFGLFVQNEFSILKTLILTTGLRYDYFKYNNDCDHDFTDNGTLDYDKNPHYDKFNPRVGINYRPLKKFSVYGSYNKSYRSPTIYDYYSSGGSSAENGYTLKPEEYEQYEIGYRWFIIKWLNLDMCAYRINIDDMLDTAYAYDGTYIGKQNVAKVHTKGFETAVSVSPIDRLSYKIAYTYTDSRYGNNTYAKQNGERVSIKDNRLTKSPYNTLSFDIDSTLLSYNGYKLFWNINMKYQDKYKMDKLNTSEYKDYVLYNSKLRLDHKMFEAFIAVENISDKEYDGHAYTTSGKDYFYPAPGVIWSWGIAYKF